MKSLNFTARQRMASARLAWELSFDANHLRTRVRDALEITEADRESFEKPECVCYVTALEKLQAASTNLMELAGLLRGTIHDPAENFPSDRAIAGVLSYIASIDGETTLDEDAREDLAAHYNIGDEEAIAAAETLANRALIGIEGPRESYHVWTINDPNANGGALVEEPPF